MSAEKNKVIMYNRIAHIMIDRQVKSVNISEKLAVTKATFSKWKSNKTQPSLENLFKIAKVLECQPSELVNDKIVNDISAKVENKRGPKKATIAKKTMKPKK